MKNMFNVTTVLPHNLLQTNPCIRHNFSTPVFRKRAAQLHYVGPELRDIFWPFLASFGGQKRPENVAQLRAHIVKLCRALSEDLFRKFVTNARVRLQEVVRQNGGHIEHVLHYEQFSSRWGLILYQMSNAFVIIKMCYVQNQWYDISCATLYIIYSRNERLEVATGVNLRK